jgi:hypothetical protein
MSDMEITLKLPEHIYQHMKQIAEASGQRLEDVMLETYTMLVDQPLALPLDTSMLEDYTDAQLWGIAYRRLPDHVDKRWLHLLEERKHRELTSDENADLERYMEMSDYYMLHRSKALVLLKQRGYDIDAYLKGA